MALAKPDLRAGSQIQELRRIVTLEDIRDYAEASGDRNPLHLDHDFARSVGFAGVIAHGMLTMGHLASCLTGWLGDAGRLVRLRASFRAVVHPGDEIVAGGRVRAIDHARGITVLEVWVSVERDGVAEYPIRRGEAEIDLA